VLYADEADKVYEYKNNNGVTEFTDQVKPDEQAVKEIKVQPMSEEQKHEATEKLNKIEKDSAILDKQLEADRRIELQEQEAANRAKQEQQRLDQQAEIQAQHNSSVVTRQNPIRPINPVIPVQPIKPAPRPLPGKPHHK